MHLIFLAGCHSFGLDLVKLLKPYSFNACIIDTPEQALDLMQTTAIEALIVHVTWAESYLHLADQSFAQLARLPRLTLGNPRQIGYTWLEQAYGEPHQEYAHLPADLHEIVAKLVNVMRAT